LVPVNHGRKLARRVVPLIVLVSSLAACGSGTTAHGSARPTAGVTPTASTSKTSATPASGATGAGATSATPASARPHTPASKSLHVVLAATASPSGSGRASLQIYVAEGEVCWSFQNLTGIANPSAAGIGIGDVGGGAVEFSLGDRYAATGCTKPAFARTGLEEIVKTPGDFFVEVSTGVGSAAKPRLRGQLAKGILAGASPSVSAPPSFTD
jgi:hypothetical protein